MKSPTRSSSTKRHSGSKTKGPRFESHNNPMHMACGDLRASGVLTNTLVLGKRWGFGVLRHKNNNENWSGRWTKGLENYRLVKKKPKFTMWTLGQWDDRCNIIQREVCKEPDSKGWELFMWFHVFTFKKNHSA